MSAFNPILRSLTLIIAMLFAWNQPLLAALPAGNAVTDGPSILRNALPTEQKDLRKMQHNLEATIREVSTLRGNRWDALSEAASSSEFVATSRNIQILQAIPKSKQKEAGKTLDALAENLKNLNEQANAHDTDGFIALRETSLNQISELEALTISSFPYSIPEEFDDLPRLLGRATVEIKTTKGEMTALIDGFNAPLTSGAFIDLVQKNFYDNLPFTRAEDFYVIQTGDPEGPELGYIDPNTNEERTVPLEIRVPNEKQALYNETFEDVGIYKATPVLPFAALGTLGWAHSANALDDGSSQFFFFLYEPELTPAGLNLIDGRNAAFGYVVKGLKVLKELDVKDKVLSINVVNGAENLKEKA